MTQIKEGKIEIYLDDLTDDAQADVLDFFGLDEPDQGNFDESPIFVLEAKDETPEENEAA